MSGVIFSLYLDSQKDQAPAARIPLLMRHFQTIVYILYHFRCLRQQNYTLPILHYAIALRRIKFLGIRFLGIKFLDIKVLDIKFIGIKLIGIRFFSIKFLDKVFKHKIFRQSSYAYRFYALNFRVS